MYEDIIEKLNNECEIRNLSNVKSEIISVFLPHAVTISARRTINN